MSTTLTNSEKLELLEGMDTFIKERLTENIDSGIKEIYINQVKMFDKHRLELTQRILWNK